MRDDIVAAEQQLLSNYRGGELTVEEAAGLLAKLRASLPSHPTIDAALKQQAEEQAAITENSEEPLDTL